MTFALTFLKTFFTMIYLVSPVVLGLLAVIVILGQIIGQAEKWSKLDALYYSFITATTVGYGDFRPTRNHSKMISIAIALLGVLLTGIIVAVGLKSLEISFEKHNDIEQVRDRFESK